MSLLEQIKYPADLRELDTSQLEMVCNDLRQYIIEVLADNPGHFASSLGTVELTVALHYVFNTPYDKIVWDVGHQAYSHKILTGRREVFKTLRTFKGISGFPNPQESEYDSFIAGHASISISAALGMATASSLKKENRNIIAVIGDGSMTGGLSFEGLNNASSNPNDLLIILNDNDIAIDNNTGGLSQYLTDITTSHAYNKVRDTVFRGMKKLKLISDDKKGFLLRFNNSLKALLTRHHNLFEGFSIRYFGPVDGHDVIGLVKTLNDIKTLRGPKILHIKTVKGKGFAPAEKSATEWHAPGRFDPHTGERIIVRSLNEPQLYQDVFGHTLLELAKQNEKIVGITPAMPSGCSMNIMMKEMPNRTFDVGIAEAHAVTFSAGLAKEGMLPFCNIYSSFAQRAYDQLIHDVALQNLNMVLCLDRAGLVGEDGATHHGALDLAYLRCIPNMIVASPINELDLRNLMFTASQPDMGPFVIRYPRGKGELAEWQNKMEILPVGKGREVKSGEKTAVLSIGPIGYIARKAIQIAEEKGAAPIGHYDMIYLKPIDEDLLHRIAQQYEQIVTVENGTIKGGLGSAVVEFLSDNHYKNEVKRIGIPDKFIEHGSIPQLYKLCGLDAESISNTLL